MLFMLDTPKIKIVTAFQCNPISFLQSNKMSGKDKAITIYMQAALDHLKKSQEISKEDEARLDD